MSWRNEGPEAWLRAQVEARLALARKATPGPWRWGDWHATFGTPEVERNTLEHAPAYGPFPAPARLRDDGSTGVLSLMDPLETDPDQEASALHIAANDPQDTIARCEAELAILDLYEKQAAKEFENAMEEDRTWVLASAVRLLASGYKHRPGYAEAWEPSEPV